MVFLVATLVVAAQVLTGVVTAQDSDEEQVDVGTVIGIDLGTTYSWLVIGFRSSYCF